jgi:GrpB-like predicted nucleotidyltransferase (UPF0157 family)
MPTAQEIIRHHDDNPDEDPWVNGPPPPQPVEIVPYRPDWPQRFAAHAADIRAALGATALDVDHVGSTSVPGLAAKDVIDIDLTVSDPRAEADYVPALEATGWVLTIREPSWHEHRCLTRRKGPRSNLHVFGPDCPEVIRHRMFRDWLTSHPEDRDRYEAAKRGAVPGGPATANHVPPGPIQLCPANARNSSAAARIGGAKRPPCAVTAQTAPMAW